MEYWICEENAKDKLQAQVNQAIAEGWQPLGGLQVVESHQSGQWWYYQALVRVYEKPVNPYPGEVV
jgi:hypothetical protein